MRDQEGAAPSRGTGQRTTLPRRSHGRRQAVARKSGDGLRCRPQRRPDLPGDGFHRGQGPAGDLEPLRPARRAVPGRGRGLHRQGAVAWPRLRPLLRRPEPGPSRRLARQCPAVLRRRGQADRLRPGDLDPEAAADRARHHLRQAQLPGARTGPPRAPRRPHRPVRVRHPAVGAFDRAAAVPGQAGRVRGRTPEERFHRRRAGSRAQPARDRPVADHRPRPARPGSHRHEGVAGEPGRTLPDRRRAARGPGRLPGQDRARDRRRPPGQVPQDLVREGHRQRAPRAR